MPIFYKQENPTIRANFVLLEKATSAQNHKSIHPTNESTRVVVTLWPLWYARRKIIHKGEYQSPLTTHLFVGRFLSDLEVLEPRPAVAQERPVCGLKWTAPPAVYPK
jgi:hypothetical protein